MPSRLRILLRWIWVPWSRLPLAVALIVASAVPAFLLASADVRQAATGDRLADRLVDELDDRRAGVVLTSGVGFVDPATSDRADAVVRAALDSLGGLEPAVRTLSSPVGAAVVGPADEPVGVPVRLLARPGSPAEAEADAAAVAPGDDEPGGVWVSAWLADQVGLEPGDTIRVDGGQAGWTVIGADHIELVVAGTYPTPWSPSGDAPTGFWADVPPSLVPRYLNPFQEPNFELLVVSQQTMAASGAPGLARWEASRSGRPRGVDELRAVVEGYDRLGLGLLRGPLADALNAQAGPARARPELQTALPDSLQRVERFTAGLAQPLAATRFAGAVVGVAVMVAGVALLVAERRAEYRLLAAEGDRWARFAGRAGLQLLAPAAVGLVLGVLSALVAARWTIADRWAVDQVDVATVTLITAVGVALAAATVGILGPRTLAERPLGWRPSSTLAAAGGGLLVLALFLWRQVGQPPADRAAVDPAVIVLPLVGVGAAVAVVLAVLSPLVRRLGHGAGTLPAVPYLAWRRVGDDQAGGRLLVAVLAVGLGLVAAATVTGRALDRGVERKLSTELGAQSQVALIGRPSDELDLPPGATLVATDTTRVTPGDRRVKIVAVDPATWADAVAWSDPDLTIEEAAALLGSDAGGDIPVIGIEGQGLPVVGVFGIQRSFPYRMVARASTVPLATDFGATLLVSAERIDRLERERLAQALGVAVTSPELDEVFRPPSSQMSQRLLSAAPVEELVAWLDGEQIRHRDARSLSARLDDVDVLAPRVAFEQLELVGLVASIASAAALVLYLDARRRKRRLASFLVRQMGLGRRAAAAVTTVEVMVLTVVAVAVVTLVTPAIAGRLIGRFDPAPTLPPDLETGLRWPILVVVALGIVLAVGVVVWAAELLASGRDDAGVVRGAG